mgnify:CR=1 FL=1
MVPETERTDAKQIDLEGKPAKRGRIKYRKLFTSHSRKKKGQTTTMKGHQHIHSSPSFPAAGGTYNDRVS